MRVLLLAQVFPPQPGGSGRWLWELYRRLPFDVTVVADRGTGTRVFDSQASVAIRRIPLRFPTWGLLDPRGSWHYGRALIQLNGLISDVKPEVVHCGKCLPEGLLALAVKSLRGLPYVCYAHGEELTLARRSRELRLLTDRVLRRADLVVANSTFTQRLLEREWNLPTARVTVLHPGVDTSRFVPAAKDTGVRARLGWTNRRVILTVGALQKRKGQDMLIRALPGVRARCPDVLYAIAGEGWERPYLEGLVAELGLHEVVQFCGQPGDDQLVEYYQQCDLFALPNRQVGWDVEGFGMVLLEAQACGKPVIAGASGGTADAVRASVTGELVPCDAPDQLTEVVVQLLTGAADLPMMGERARRWVVDEFDWNRLSRQAAGVLSEFSRVHLALRGPL